MPSFQVTSPASRAAFRHLSLMSGNIAAAKVSIGIAPGDPWQKCTGGSAVPNGSEFSLDGNLPSDFSINVNMKSTVAIIVYFKPLYY